MSVEIFLSKLDNNAQQNQSILSKYEDDIQKLVDKKIKQTIIIQYLFSVDEEIKNKYDDVKNIKTLKVIVSNFIKKLKHKKRIKNVKNKIEVNSPSCEVEEPENIDEQIISQKSENVGETSLKINMFQKIIETSKNK